MAETKSMAETRQTTTQGLSNARAQTFVLMSLVLVLALLPLLANVLGVPSLISLVTRILILAIAASSLNLALGYAGLVSFGHAAWYGIGAYVVGILYRHSVSGETLLGLSLGSDQLLVTVPMAMLITGLCAGLIGAVALRTSGIQFIMITLAFAQMIFFFFVALKAYGGDDGLIIRRRNELPFVDLRENDNFYWLSLTVCVLWIMLMSRIVHSRFGAVLLGIRQSERRMAAIGIATYPYKLVVFILSGMGCGLAGALMANHARFVSPDMMHWTQSGELMIMVILGGAGTLLGPAAGAAALILLEMQLGALTEHWQIILGPLLVLMILFWKGGLSGLWRQITGARHD